MALMDLLLGLMVGAIVLAAAATMADAMSHGKRANEQISRSANYLAQLHTRLSDLIMRAESITGGLNNIELTVEGKRVWIYSDDSRRIVVKEIDEPEPNVFEYDYKIVDAATQHPASAQENIRIMPVDINRVTITFDIEGVSYTMTAARRGGLLE